MKRHTLVSIAFEERTVIAGVWVEVEDGKREAFIELARSGAWVEVRYASKPSAQIPLCVVPFDGYIFELSRPLILQPGWPIELCLYCEREELIDAVDGGFAPAPLSRFATD